MRGRFNRHIAFACPGLGGLDEVWFKCCQALRRSSKSHPERRKGHGSAHRNATDHGEFHPSCLLNSQVSHLNPSSEWAQITESP